VKTPAGTECRFFYGDYYRGKNLEECRLVGNVLPPNDWTPDLCKTCPVPAILRANACPHMVFQGEVKSLVLGMRRRVVVSAYCTKSEKVVKEPEIGCGICHPLPPGFEKRK
jgi:hypothetical protein